MCDGNSGATFAAGAGGVGCFAIQMAKRVGAKVITTCGALNEKFVEKLGADHNFNYRGLGEVRHHWQPLCLSCASRFLCL